MNDRPEIRPIPAGDETWVGVVRLLASKVATPDDLEARLRERYPDAVVRVSGLAGLVQPVWYVFKRRWFERL